MLTFCLRLFFLSFLFSISGRSLHALETTSAESIGLQVRKGVIYHQGREFRAIGANYFNLFYRTLKDPTDDSYDEGLSKLAKAKIPFVRFMAGGFWPVDWDLYFNNKEAYFQRMDSIIRSAERHQIGLIPSLFWNMATFPDLVGEPMDQLGKHSSKSIEFIKQYTREMVQRYNDSPAIWGWEFGNEYNLHIDLPNASKLRPKVAPHLKTALERSSRDELSAHDMLVAFENFARTVRLYDTNRILSTGNSIPRPSAYHNSKENSWKIDTKAQFETVLHRDNPPNFDVTSVHIYGNTGQGGTNSILKMVQTLQNASKRTRQPLFVGEFGASQKLGAEHEKALFLEIVDAIETSNVPLSAFWVFDYSDQDNDWNVTFENKRSYMLKHVAEANQRIHTRMNDQERLH